MAIRRFTISSAAVMLFALVLVAPAAGDEKGTADITTREIGYEVGGMPFRGFVALPKNGSKLPGVIVVHEWWGHNQYARYRARKLAEAGYAAFALDMYGGGRTADNPTDADRLMQEALHSGMMQRRFERAVQVLKDEPRVDGDRVAAIGYCFGGSVVMTMAVQGEPLRAFVGFHSAFAQIPEVSAQTPKGEVLILHGGADQFAPTELLHRFEAKLDAAKARYSVTVYPGAQHGFTDPDANRVAEMHHAPVGYDANADEQSWAAMLALFKRVL